MSANDSEIIEYFKMQYEKEQKSEPKQRHPCSVRHEIFVT